MVTISRLCLCVKPLTKRAGGVPPKEGGPGSLQSSPTGPPPKSAVPAKTGPMVDAPKVANVPVPKAAGADAASAGGTGGCDTIDSGITHPRPEVPPPRAIKSAPAGPSTQAKRVPKGIRTQAKVTKLTNSKVTKVTSRRAKAANTASNTAVADPPGRER